MTQEYINKFVVRYGELVPCKTAFIDAYTPSSNQKENFTIIGGGVSESADQHVHIKETPGFNIGAAGQPPKCKNSLHTHTTAEVFFVLKSKWRYFWGIDGDAGEFIAEEGDIFNIPTGIFRGFENVGTDYGMIMSILGGDDAGGGVTWAPHVIESAQAHGLILSEDGKLYDTVKGESLPHGVQPMPVLTDEELKAYNEPTAKDVISGYVGRYWDLVALAQKQPVNVIGPTGYLKDKPGFSVDFITRDSGFNDFYQKDKHEVIMPMRGHWKLTLENGTETVLNPGDTALIKPNMRHKIEANFSGESSLYLITETDDPAGLTWDGCS